MSVKQNIQRVVQPALAVGFQGIPCRCSEVPLMNGEQGCSPNPQPRMAAPHAGFTLIELLTVIAVIAIVTAMSVPALKNFKRADADAAATRQLADEISNARQRAIMQRADVYLVFIPPAQNALEADESIYRSRLASVDLRESQQATNLLRMQLTGYGFYSERTVGDQPGWNQPRYHGDWRQLPEGTFIVPSKFFVDTPAFTLPDGTIVPPVQRFSYRPFPFPLASSPPRLLPYIGFDHLGRVFHEDINTGIKVYDEDAVIPLARGSVSTPSGAGTQLTATAEEKPPNNSVDAYTFVVVDWLTGRAKIERQQVQ